MLAVTGHHSQSQSPMQDQLEPISLADLIDQVKRDLLDPAVTGGAEPPLLYVDAIEVTAQVVARREKGEGGKAGLSLSVLGLKADAGVDTKTGVAGQLTQAVTVKLSPLVTKAEYLEGLSASRRDKLAETAAKGAVRGSQSAGGEIA
jgi:hypothetical protein